MSLPGITTSDEKLDPVRFTDAQGTATSIAIVARRRRGRRWRVGDSPKVGLFRSPSLLSLLSPIGASGRRPRCLLAGILVAPVAPPDRTPSRLWEEGLATMRADGEVSPTHDLHKKLVDD